MVCSSVHQRLLAPISHYLDSLRRDAVMPEHIPILDGIASYAAEVIRAGRTVRLTFICTHNSRRSHLAQVWAQVVAHWMGLAPVECYSGGTEVTACNLRTVAALKRAGLEIVPITTGENPIYLIRYAEGVAPIAAFSKIYDAPPNPREHFGAVMTCAQAEKNCPFVVGAERRFSLPYDDPKIADDTPQEGIIYDERCRQIAREMLYLWERAIASLTNE
ncbi:MAG: protein-tyrosine-phosphatase [Saprospiraceae bacterium]|nr:protein-tyrosine-phosphatase [Saprospiraceae bacterium]MDW8484514.1 protein-tyrosine-phosphatase [Saprospiraceae bacterium]